MKKVKNLTYVANVEPPAKRRVARVAVRLLVYIRNANSELIQVPFILSIAIYCHV